MTVLQSDSASTVRRTTTAVQGAEVAALFGHPLLRLVWVLAGLAIAAGVGPWISHHAGVMLPAFALVRTRGRGASA